MASISEVDVVTLLGDLVRTETRLYHALDDELRRAHGLVTSQYEFLRFVGGHPRPRVADLAAEFAVGVGATSKAVDRLAGRGWVERHANPDDRRSTVLALTVDGGVILAAADATVRALLGDVVERAGPSAEDLLALGRALAALRGSLERDGRGTPVG